MRPEGRDRGAGPTPVDDGFSVPETTPAPYDNAEAYRAKGWTGTLPLPTAKKAPLPSGFTGYEGAWPSGADIAEWRAHGYRSRDPKTGEVVHNDASNIAIRLPPNVIGLDVDHYGDKAGADELAKLATEWGELPPTWRSTSRTDGVSGIYLYRLRAVIDQHAWPTGASDSIEIIRYAHRYCVCWPSVHDKTGLTYRWYRPDGNLAEEGEIPGPGDLAELPESWVTGLTGHGGDGDHVKPGSRASHRELEKAAREWIQRLPTGGPCAYVGRLAADLTGATNREDGNAYDATRDVVMALLRAGEAGHPGVRAVLLDGRVAYANGVQDDRPRAVAEGEYDRFTLGGVIKVLAEPGEKAGRGCDCRGSDRDHPDRDARPELDVTNAAEAADWLRDHLGTGRLAGMFNRAGEIVFCPRQGEDGYIEPPEGDDDGPAQVRTVDASRIASTIQWTHWCYRWVKADDDYVKRAAMFPKNAARVAVDVPDMVTNLRPLRGVIHTPIVRRDGTILAAAGYDTQARLLHLPEPGLAVPRVPDRPTAADIAAAVAVLQHMVSGFPFVTDHGRTNYIGLLVTPLLKLIAPPPYKLFAVTAKQPGSGKTLLATCARIIHGGVFRGTVAEDDAEVRKAVTSILDQTTGPIVTFDNVTGTLDSAVLAALLTSATHTDRRLGATEEVDRINDRVWTVTGNNVRIGGDLPRRTVVVEIDPRRPNPERRTGFAIPDLESWTREHRGDILHALLTLVRAWVVAGGTSTPAGSDGYSRWIGIVRGILSHAGFAGVFDDDTVKIDVGSSDDEWAEFLAAVESVYGTGTWTVKELLGKVNISTFAGTSWVPEEARGQPIPLDALPSELAEKLGRSHTGVMAIAKSLGMWLRNREGRWAGQLAVRKSGQDRDKIALWRIESAGSAGSAGSSSNPENSVSGDKSGDNREETNSGGPETDPADPADPADAKSAACPKCGWELDSLGHEAACPTTT